MASNRAGQKLPRADPDMVDLNTGLSRVREAGAHHAVIAANGVFSMDGHVARLDAICNPAQEFDALFSYPVLAGTRVVGRVRGWTTRIAVRTVGGLTVISSLQVFYLGQLDTSIND